VSVGGRSGWARRHPAGPFQPADTFKAHQAWMGNHAFLLKGKCMLGSDAPSLVLTNALLLGCGLYHFLVVLPRLTAVHTQTSIWYGASIFLLVAAFVLLWITACLDPGIIPARSSPLRPEPPAGVVGHSSNSYRYCSTCNIFRPPRSKHCNSCNVCVSEFDHHCPWTGNCIGERNHMWFVCFLVAVTTLSSFVTGCVAILVADTFFELLEINTGGIGPIINSKDSMDSTSIPPSLLYDKDAWSTLWEAISAMPVTVLFGLFLLLCAWSLLSLLAYHSLLISVAQTTNERVRGVYLTSRNPRDKGCCLNCVTFFTRRTSPSRLPPDFSKEVKLQHARVEAPWSDNSP
jgi:palmitoyltransferase ZDHHC9/14/18